MDQSLTLVAESEHSSEHDRTRKHHSPSGSYATVHTSLIPCQARTKKRLRSDFLNAPPDGDKQSNGLLDTPRPILFRSDGGRGKAIAHHDSNTTDGEWGQDVDERVGGSYRLC